MKNKKSFNTLSLALDSWQRIIINNNKTPARSVIKLFSDIVYWHRPINSGKRKGQHKFIGEKWHTTLGYLSE